MNENCQIQWKQQHLNNSCAWACLAMLFSRWGIDIDDRELVASSLLPYVLTHHMNGDDDYLSAGVLRQSVDIFNRVSAPYGMRCTEHRLASWSEYEHIAMMLLQHTTPFFTGISAKALPTPAYETLRQGDAPDRGHAIVIFRHANDVWHGFDPAADLDRRREYVFADIADRVTVTLSTEAFQTGMLHKPGTRFLLLFAEPDACDERVPISTYVEQSRVALSIFSEKMDALLGSLASSASCSSEVFHDVLFHYIKPVALDFRVALDVVMPKTAEQQELSQVLREFQDHILTIQASFREAEPKQLDNLQHVSELVGRIVALSGQHLNQCPLAERL
jgi:hypothetical protein